MRGELSLQANPLVYVLDDERAICAMLTDLLEELGYRSREFTRLSEMEVALALEAPRAILVDLTLGDTDAIEVMRSLANRRFGGALILMSGRHDLATLQRVQEI